MKFNNRKVLFAPLDWGLGHATRCIPLMNAFIKRDWQVIVAADGAIEHLLRKEFPQQQFIKLKGYNVEYSNRKWSMPFKMVFQVPKILAAINAEQLWLQKALERYEIDLVVSDNRFGLYSEKIPCIFITHQLNIKAPYRWMEARIKKLNYKYISRFTECWVPDAEVNSLAAELSHLSELHPFPIKYIGPLSRFRKQMAAIRYKYAFLLSGPEPQRTLLEKKILKDIHLLRDDVLIVRGKPQDNQQFTLPSNVAIVNHLEGEALEKAVNASEYIVSRSGYTTVMEIAALQKRSILIPTPGQTEQEYLAANLMNSGFAFSVSQQSFELMETLKQAASFAYETFPLTQSMLEPVLDNFLSRYFQTKSEKILAD